MNLQGKNIGFALTGSHCTLDEITEPMRTLVDNGAEVIPIISQTVYETDTRFGKADDWAEQIMSITGRTPISTIVEAEPIGPKKILDVLVIAPCTGNTLAKLANGITDGAVLMAAKAQLRNEKPLVIAISTNDGLGFNAKNVGTLINAPNIYMVPFGQDSPHDKSRSLVAKMEFIPETVHHALQRKQIQPMIVQYE